MTDDGEPILAHGPATHSTKSTVAVTTEDPSVETRPPRPGPFGPARALIPPGQVLLVIDAGTPAWDALERMTDNNYSQLPVRSGNRITGVFTWRSFASRVAELRDTRASPAHIEVRECLERPVFVGPDDDIDRAADWAQADYVIVGTPEAPIGLITVSDVLARLTDFAAAFVLIADIEQEMRSLIRETVGPADLERMIKSLSLPHGAAPPSTRLEDLTFGQYRQMICCRENWPSFERRFDTRRELLDADLGVINDLRNDAFHFRRELAAKDIDRLRRFRDRIRHNRSL